MKKSARSPSLHPSAIRLKPLGVSGRAQRGIIDPKIIIGGIVILVVVFFLATGKFNFSATVDKNANKPSDQNQQTTTPTPESKPKTYQDEASGITLEYPADWSLRENTTNDFLAVFSSPKEGSSDNYTEALGIRVVDISSRPSVTLQEIADLWENQTKEATPSLVVTDRTASTLADVDAKEIVYDFKDDKGNGRGMARIALKNNKAYILQFSAAEKDYERYLLIIKTILSSVKF